MNKIRIVLANRQKEFRKTLRDLIQSQPDMTVVGEVLDSFKLLLVVRETKADVIVISLSDTSKDPGICSHLLAEFPNLLILALSRRHKRALIYRQVVIREPLTSISDQEILTAIRKVEVDVH